MRGKESESDEDSDIFPFSESARIAKTRAEMYGFLATLYNKKPDFSLVERLLSFDVNALVALASEKDMSSLVNQGLCEMATFIETAAGQADDEIEYKLAVDWTRLFRGVSPKYGPPPPYEGLYLGGGDTDTDIIQAVNHWYLEHGVSVGSAYRNRPDYLGLELDFMRHLADREAKAWECLDRQEAMDFLKKSYSFMSDHLTPWVCRFCEQAIQQAETAFYRGLIMITRGVVMEVSGMCAQVTSLRDGVKSSSLSEK